jgi:hypothetical protein
MSEPWDWPRRADERRRYFKRVIDTDYRIVRRRRTIGFLSCVMIVGVTLAIIVRLAWAPILGAFALVGVTSPGTMAAVVIGLVIMAATSLHAKVTGRPF